MVNMKSLAEKFLTRSEQEQVTAVVHEMEQTTSGEIVPLVVSRSHRYPMANVLCSLFLSIPLGLLLTDLLGPAIWLGPRNMWLFLILSSASSAIFYALTSRSDRITRLFLNQREVEQEVREGALAAFYAEKLHKTAEENGILLYISVLEQRVWILADSGINKKIDAAEWDAVVADLTAGIKAGNRCHSLCAAIRRTGQILHRHFPHQRDDRDELHNLIIR
jgi:putative membrane protein